MSRRKGEVPALSAGRTVALSAALVGVFAAVICLGCTVLGVTGSALVDAGLATLEELSSPANVIAVIIVGSIVLASIVCIGVYRTFVLPLRKMTLAVGELAHGNFTYRMDARKKGFRVREVTEFAESFNVAAKELQGTEMMRAGFISDFSHEFRTPIMSLSGFAELLMEADLPAEEQREYLGIIHDEAQRLSGLSERILTLSKVEALTILPNVRKVDVAEQLRRAVALLESRLAEKNVTTSLSLDPGFVQGNADYLAQLWLNLLDNAIKFSPEKGSIDIALYGGRAGEEERSSEDDAAVVWISDEGCGMDLETQAHIFDRFYQGDTSRASVGSGLGLALCKRIVELHHGQISVQSAPGKGSVFEVRLPLMQPGGAPKEP